MGLRLVVAGRLGFVHLVYVVISCVAVPLETALVRLAWLA